MSKMGWFVMGYFVAVVVSLFIFENKSTPTAMDVYQNKTTLKYTIVDGEKTDSTVIWKKE